MSSVGSLAPEFGLVVMTAGAIGLQILMHGFRFAGGARKVFDADYYRQPAVQALVEEHKKATGEAKLPKGGLPDMGSGRYSALLPYASWFKFNNGQRAHYNYVEGVASILVFLLLSGLFFPRFAAAAGLVYIVGREAFAIGYATGGPNKRAFGAVLLDLALFALFGATMYGGWQLAQPALGPSLLSF